MHHFEEGRKKRESSRRQHAIYNVSNVSFILKLVFLFYNDSPLENVSFWNAKHPPFSIGNYIIHSFLLLFPSLILPALDFPVSPWHLTTFPFPLHSHRSDMKTWLTIWSCVLTVKVTANVSPLRQLFMGWEKREKDDHDVINIRYQDIKELLVREKNIRHQPYDWRFPHSHREESLGEIRDTGSD